MNKIHFFISALLLLLTSCRDSEKNKTAYEYQLTLEEEAIYIYDGDRLVASVPYEQTGILDSVFIADNE